MLTTASHIQRPTTAPEPSHTFTAPVVREIPRPAPEPLSWSACW